MSRNIGYHTRLYADNTVKLTGGSFGGRIDQETVERLTSLFTVIVKPSGTCVFVDRNGREVRLYLSVDAGETRIGKEAKAAWYRERAKMQEKQERREQLEAEELDNLMSGLDHSEIVRRLRGES